MRKEHHQAVLLAPLIFGSDDVLVDHYLSTVDKIAKLCLPHDKRVGVAMRIAVLETKRCILAQQRVIHPKTSLGIGQSVQWHPPCFIVIVDKC